MRIATLGNASVIHTGRWVEWFRRRGHEVALWSMEPGPESLGARGLPAAPVPGFLRYPLALPALRRALGAFAPDIVDAHFVPNYGLLGALSGRRPLAVVAWGSDLLVSGAPDPLRAARTRFVLGRADLVLADSGNLAAAAERLGAPADRVHAIPWGVDRSRFHPAPGREAGLIATTRMHEPIYDLDTVIEGVAGALTRHPDACLVVTGDGSQRGRLEALAARRLPAGRWSFTGRLGNDEMAALLARSDLYVSGSLSDSTSVSLLEAMASGAVPVVSDLEGNREWVGEPVGARLFAPGDAAGLAAALDRALDDAAWREAARARNLRVIAERADTAVQMGKIEALYQDLVERRR